MPALTGIHFLSGFERIRAVRKHDPSFFHIAIHIIHDRSDTVPYFSAFYRACYLDPSVKVPFHQICRRDIHYFVYPCAKNIYP